MTAAPPAVGTSLLQGSPQGRQQAEQAGRQRSCYCCSKLNFRCLQRTKHSERQFLSIPIFFLHTSPVILNPLYKWGNQGFGRLRSCPSSRWWLVTELSLMSCLIFPKAWDLYLYVVLRTWYMGPHQRGACPQMTFILM